MYNTDIKTGELYTLPVVRRRVPVQGAPVDAGPVPGPRGHHVLEPGPVPVGEHGPGPAVVRQVRLVAVVGVVDGAGDVVEPAVVAADGHRVGVVRRQQHCSNSNNNMCQLKV